MTSARAGLRQGARRADSTRAGRAHRSCDCAIPRASPSASAPFVGLLRTDATVDGYVQAANGGTLFLDEVAKLDLAVQAKLPPLYRDAPYLAAVVTPASNRLHARRHTRCAPPPPTAKTFTSGSGDPPCAFRPLRERRECRDCGELHAECHLGHRLGVRRACASSRHSRECPRARRRGLVRAAAQRTLAAKRTWSAIPPHARAGHNAGRGIPWGRPDPDPWPWPGDRSGAPRAPAATRHRCGAAVGR